jgi:hypothetical protein
MNRKRLPRFPIWVVAEIIRQKKYSERVSLVNKYIREVGEEE